MYGSVNSKRCGDPDLARFEKLLRFLFDSGAQALSSKPAKDVTNGDGSEATLWLAQGHEAGSGKVFGQLLGGIPAHKELNSFSELFQDAGAVSGSQSFKEVLHSKT